MDRSRCEVPVGAVFATLDLDVIGRTGLQYRLQPSRCRGGEDWTALFELQERLERLERSIAELTSTFDNTANGQLAGSDVRTYRRELARRRRQCNELSKKRDAVLAAYAQDLIDSRVKHPALRDLV